MSTETTFYRVRRTVDGKHQWLDLECGPNWLDNPGIASAWAFLSGLDGADHCAKAHGGKVIPVRHKLIPAKLRTHDRAWALRQLAKGRKVGNVNWVESAYVGVCERHGLALFGMGGGAMTVGGSLKNPDGYTLWQEPAK